MTNVLFFLTPKNEIDYVYDDDTVRQIMEKMQIHHYGVIPVIRHDGTYVSTISEGDILRFIYECDFDKEIAENKHYEDITLSRAYKSLDVEANIGQILELLQEQNFLPIVDDRNIFIGIVKRKDLIKNYLDVIKNK